MDMLIKGFLAANSSPAAARKGGCGVEQNQVFAAKLLPLGADRRIDPRIRTEGQRIIVARELEMFPRARQIRLRQQTLTPMKLQLSRLPIELGGPLKKLRRFREFLLRRGLHPICIKRVKLRLVGGGKMAAVH